jgi:hypothetical protein
MKNIIALWVFLVSITASAALVRTQERTPDWVAAVHNITLKYNKLSEKHEALTERVNELEARYLFLENQLELLTQGDANSARLMRNWERWGDE